jgi:DNA polymerase III subunit epsilon
VIPLAGWPAAFLTAVSAFPTRITEKVPEPAGSAERRAYLAVLDRCLSDRRLSADEADELIATAERLGLSLTTCLILHDEYFDGLTDAAWADGLLTPAESDDLLAVAVLLDITVDRVAEALQPRLVAVPR